MQLTTQSTFTIHSIRLIIQSSTTFLARVTPPTMYRSEVCTHKFCLIKRIIWEILFGQVFDELINVHVWYIFVALCNCKFFHSRQENLISYLPRLKSLKLINKIIKLICGKNNLGYLAISN